MLLKIRLNIEYGDVITYWEEDALITHRIMEIKKEKIMPMGDNNNEEDREISKNKVLGKVIFHSVIVGRIVTIYLKYIFVVFTIVVVFMNVYSFQGRKKNEREQNKTSQ